ncbi:MAG: AAA family ATPase, partial [Oscillospiraceae bacterium]
GISFKMADTIAAKIGFDRNSKERIASGIKFMMNSVAYLNGHTFMPRSAMITQAAGFLEVEVSNVEEVVSKLLLEKELVIENMGEYDGIYLKLFYDAEKTVAERLISMSQIVFDVDSNDINARIADIEEETDIKLADMQIEAVQTVFENSALVITGGPGTGKTTIINTIIKIMEKMHKRVALAAPTGRAAKRMTEVCGVEAKTIHRLLEIEPGADEIGRQFARNAENTLECDILIVDEMSMVDILLMSSLLLAMPKNAKIIMVGDSDQLPSVGAGNVLKDIIESGTVSCIQLTEIFRQAKESMIVVNAHRINHGEMPLLNDQDNDFFLVNRSDPDSLCGTIADLCERRLPAHYGVDSISQIQILTPTRKTAVGVQYLNQVLQDRLNPPDTHKKEHATKTGKYRVGDKVMQIRNNYHLEWEKEDKSEKGSGVFNGDVGFIIDIETHKQKVVVAYDDKIVKYDFLMLDELELAYAVTVHKSQGSEFEVVIIPMMEVHRLLMTRNLLYTAITRAKTLVVLVGQEEIIKKYIDNDNVQMRFSGLKNKLQIF